MTHRHPHISRRTFVAAAAAGLASQAGPAWSRRTRSSLPSAWTVVALADLPGGQNYSQATAISADGRAVGWAGALHANGSSFEDHACLWSHLGAPTDLGVLPGDPGTWTQARGINRLGQIVGVSQGRPCLWQGGAPLDLGMLPGGRPTGTAMAINDQGMAVGYASGPSQTSEPFYWQNGTSGLIPLPCFTDRGYGQALNINSAGVIVGTSRDIYGYGLDRAVRWVEGVLSDLGFPGRGQANGINAQNVIVGESNGRARRWEADVVTDLGSFNGDTGTASAKDINLYGDIVGSSSKGGRVVAVLWQDGQLTDLNEVPGVSGTGWQLQVATAINDAGAIAGNGISPAGLSRGFVLLPQ